MSRKNSLVFILGWLVLLLVVSCSPAQVTAPPQPQPLSTSNPSLFSTMVAEKAEAFMTQTMEAMPTATATLPPPTNTPTPTITATPTDTNEKTSLSKMEDGSIQFFDYQAGLELTVPAGWLAVRLSEQEFLDAVVAAEDEPVLLYHLEAIKNLDPVIYRLHAFNTKEDYVYEGEGSSISVLFIKGNTQELELIAEAEVQPKNFDNYELITSEYQVRTDSLELFTLDESWQVVSSTEQQVTVYHKRVVLKVSNGTVYIDLYAPSELKDDVLPEFNTLIEGLSIFVP